MWVDLFASDDGGKTWDFLSRVNDFGAPGSLVVKKDGRFVMVYGYRLMPSGMRCRVSEDEGKTWGPELIIRDDGGSWDLGYGDAWEMPDRSEEHKSALQSLMRISSAVICLTTKHEITNN